MHLPPDTPPISIAVMGGHPRHPERDTASPFLNLRFARSRLPARAERHPVERTVFVALVPGLSAWWGGALPRGGFIARSAPSRAHGRFVGPEAWRRWRPGRRGRLPPAAGGCRCAWPPARGPRCAAPAHDAGTRPAGPRRRTPARRRGL